MQTRSIYSEQNGKNNPHKIESPELEKEEIQAIAGYNPDEPLQLDQEYQLIPEQPPPKSVSERAALRAGTVLFLTGGLILVGLGLWLAIQPKPVKKVAEQPFPQPKPVISEEKPDFRAKLALKDQERKNQPAVQPKPVPTKQPETSSTAPTVKPQPSPPVVTNTRPHPPAPTRAVKPVDPLSQWNQLAQLGQTQGKPHQEEKFPPPDKTDTTNNTGEGEVASIPVVNIGYQSVSESQMSEGARGILNRNRVEPSRKIVKQVALGTTAPAVTSVPLIWDSESGEQLYHRFALTLTDNLPAADGEVALPAGTVLIAQAQTVGRENRLVQAAVMALVYTDSQGEVVSQSIPAGAILVQGSQGEPLIAQDYFNPNPDITSADLLVSLLSGVGKVGEVFTKPQETSTFSNNTVGGSSSSTVIRSREPQIWSAVLDGFFNPLQSRIAKRSDREIKELLNRPNIAIVPVGTETSITVSGFINIAR